MHARLSPHRPFLDGPCRASAGLRCGCPDHRRRYRGSQLCGRAAALRSIGADGQGAGDAGPRRHLARGDRRHQGRHEPQRHRRIRTPQRSARRWPDGPAGLGRAAALCRRRHDHGLHHHRGRRLGTDAAYPERLPGKGEHDLARLYQRGREAGRAFSHGREIRLNPEPGHSAGRGLHHQGDRAVEAPARQGGADLRREGHQPRRRLRCRGAYGGELPGHHRLDRDAVAERDPQGPRRGAEAGIYL